MKKNILITGILLLAGIGFAQELACDCADCREKAAAAAEGKAFTLPGLEGLNGPAPVEKKHDHAADADEPEGHDHAAHAGEHKHAEEDGCCPSDAEPAAEHAGCDHDHGGHAEGVVLSEEMMENVGIKLQAAAGGAIIRSSVFPAEIKLNRDRTAAVSPRYPSVVRQVFAEIGETVRKGDVLASLENRETMAVYSVSAPRDGVIISKNLAVGEAAPEERVLYEVADLSSVWADISIFPKYQHLIRKGMAVELIAHDGHTAAGTIQYISPLVSHETRTFTARCVLKGAREDFTPGAFVRARIPVEQRAVPVAVPVDAVQVLDGYPAVFVPGDHGFQPLEIRTGLSDGKQVEVLSGLKPGDTYVARGAFVLKAQMLTSGMDPHAGHGH